MTLKQFHAALKKKWPHLTFDPEAYTVWVGDLQLSWDEDVCATTTTGTIKGYGDSINAAVKDLKHVALDEIRESQAALQQIEEACKKN